MTNTFRIITLIKTLLIFSNFALAGGWVVGGGEIIEDSTNPWFLNNTPIVRYCVVIDESNFGFSKSQALQSIENGIKFWRRQYQKTNEHDSDIPVLNGQIYIEEACNNTTDLKFQFGHLDLEQMDQLNNISRKVAVAVRTGYDRINIRGKGFVYISPEKGPLRLSNPRVIKNPWSRSEGAFLDLVLIHELGHVFGQRHLNNNGIMDELFVEITLSNEPDSMTIAYSQYIVNQLNIFKLRNEGNLTLYSCSTNIEPIPLEPPNSSNPNPNPKSKIKYFNRKIAIAKNLSNLKSLNSWSQMKTIQGFFGLDFEPLCVYSFAGWKDNKYFIAISFASEHHNLSTLKIQQEPNSYVRSDIESALTVYLPKEQKVFAEQSNIEYASFGVKEKLVVFKSHFVNEIKGIKRPVVISINNSSMPTITAEFQGTAYLNILDGI